MSEAARGLDPEGQVLVEVAPGRVGVVVDGELLATGAVAGSFPDYRGIVAWQPGWQTVDACGLRELLAVDMQSVGPVVRDGCVRPAATGEGDAAEFADVFVDPEFLHEALAVAGPRPTPALDGPQRPLAIRGDGAGFSVLMPVVPSGPVAPPVRGDAATDVRACITSNQGGREGGHEGGPA